MFQGLKKFVQAVRKGLSDDSSFSSLISGGVGTPLASGANDATLLASNKNWVFVCTNAIAKNISAIELKLRKYNTSGDDEEIYDHEVLALLQKPNRFQTGKDFMYMIAAHLELTGNAYILKDDIKNPKELLPLLPSQVTIKYDKENPAVVQYVVRGYGKQKTYDSEFIIHIKQPNPQNIFKGKGTLEAIAEWVDVDSAATEFNRLFFQNGAAPSGILKTDATDQKGLKIAKEGFEMRYQGALNMHKTAVLPKGAEYTALSSPKDMQFTEADARFRDKILSGFGVPKSVVGIVEDVNRANAESSNYVFMAFTIDPKMKNIVSYLDYMLLEAFGLKGHYFTYDNIIPDNEDLKLRKNQTALAGQAYESINEVRASEGKPPIENGDYVMGGAFAIPIGKPSEKSAGDGQPREKQTKKMNIRFRGVHQKEDLTDGIFSKVADSLAKKTKEAIREQKHQKFITRVTPYESKFAKSVLAVNEEMKKIVLENLDDEKAHGTWGHRKSLISTDRVEALFVSMTIPVLQDLNKEEGQAQLDDLEIPTPFNPMNERIQKRIKDTLKLTSQSYTETTLRLLNDQLDEGVAAGESMDKLKERVASVFELTNEYRAEAIARTTVFGVANASAREAYIQSEVVSTVMWHTAEDEMVCEFCEPMNGKVVDVDADFFKAGQTLTGRDGGKIAITGFNQEDPPVHPNCRCFTLAEDIEVTRD